MGNLRALVSTSGRMELHLQVSFWTGSNMDKASGVGSLSAILRVPDAISMMVLTTWIRSTASAGSYGKVGTHTRVNIYKMSGMASGLWAGLTAVFTKECGRKVSNKVPALWSSPTGKPERVFSIEMCSRPLSSPWSSSSPKKTISLTSAFS